MNAEVLQVISIIAFSLSGIFLVVAAILFFKLNIRSVMDDLSGKKAERQIKELREMNRQASDSGHNLYQPSMARASNETRNVTLSNGLAETTEKLKEAEDSTSLLQEEGTTLLGEGTTLLAEEGTTLLNNVMQPLRNGYCLLFNEIVIHTKERI